LKRKKMEAILGTLRVIDGDMDRLDEAAAARLGISRSDFRCLDILSRGRALTPGQLASETGLSTGAITALLDRLERAGYIARQRDRHDRRSVLIVPSERSTREVWPIFRGVTRAATRILSRFSLGELESIARFLDENRAAIHNQLPKVQHRAAASGSRRGKTRPSAPRP
jgi:DNA-binding MarR family transcriptional regulator